jgi:hypothetical protein
MLRYNSPRIQNPGASGAMRKIFARSTIATAPPIVLADTQSLAQQNGTQQPGAHGGTRGGAAKGAPSACSRGAAPPLSIRQKPTVPNPKAVRSCMLALSNTNIVSAGVDPSLCSVCRVTAITRHPPENDRVPIWIALPTSDWNSRFMGTQSIELGNGD